MARGFTWCVYVDDNGGQWALAIDSDYVTHPERGWQATGDSVLAPLPRAWRARRVVGLDASGRVQFAVVASVEADLWSGAALDFVIRDSEGQIQPCRVLRRVAERRTTARADPEI